MFAACLVASIGLLALALKLMHGGNLDELGRRAATGGVVAFLAVFVAWTLTTMPAIPLMIASGALFGPWRGALYSQIGGMLGLSLAFWIGRWLGEHRFDALARRHPTIARAASWAETRPLAVIALMRLAPVFPVTVLNYGVGASPMSFGVYFWASFAMLVPGAAMYAGVGDVAFVWWNDRSLAASTVVVIAVALVAAGGTAWWMRRHRRQAIDAAGAEHNHAD